MCSSVAASVQRSKPGTCAPVRSVWQYWTGIAQMFVCVDQIFSLCLCQVLRVYKAGIQQTLDILFLGDGKEFISSTDAVSRDSAELTLVAWDFDTTAQLSNQIFHVWKALDLISRKKRLHGFKEALVCLYQERYTCPCLASHPLESSFVAQTNGSYMALFSAQRPYRMNKRRRYEGHKVSVCPSGVKSNHCESISNISCIRSRPQRATPPSGVPNI